jgi:hypothetical protein
VLVNPFTYHEDQSGAITSGDTTVTVCLKPSGRRVLVATIDPDECLCELNASIILPRSSDRWLAFVISLPSEDRVVVIDTHGGRFERFDVETCSTCAPGPAIPSLAVGPSGAVAWVVDERELELVGPRGFDLFLHATGRTRRIDHRERSISDLRVGKTAVTWRDAGRPRRLRLS